MDYKELIEELRTLSKHVPEQMCDAEGKDPLERAATAIETLLAEREATLKDLKKLGCRTCKYLDRNPCENPCGNCIETGSELDEWRWRGPAQPNKVQLERGAQ